MQSLRCLIRRSTSIFITAALGLLSAQTVADPLDEAQSKLKQHDLNGAYEVVQKAAAQKPESVELSSALGGLDYLRGELSDAEIEFKRALRLDDKFARAWVGLGRVFEAASFREKARACYRNAWKTNPNDAEVPELCAHACAARTVDSASELPRPGRRQQRYRNRR
jgi:tetratricopeptide (TPR) repeat protein